MYSPPLTIVRSSWKVSIWHTLAQTRPYQERIVKKTDDTEPKIEQLDDAQLTEASGGVIATNAFTLTSVSAATLRRSFVMCCIDPLPPTGIR